MGARRKLRATEDALTARAPRPALAAAQAAPVDSPVHSHLARLEASFADPQAPAPYPRLVRAAIMLGAPAALWVLVIASVGALARAAGA